MTRSQKRKEIKGLAREWGSYKISQLRRALNYFSMNAILHKIRFECIETILIIKRFLHGNLGFQLKWIK